MRYGSVCSGIEAATVAWQPIGWTAVFFSEIDPFACALLAQRHAQVPNVGDMRRFEYWPDATIDHSGSGRMDFESETFTAHSLRADGFDGSEDGTGRGVPLVPVAFTQNQRDEVRALNVAGALSSIRRGDAKNETLLAEPYTLAIRGRGDTHDLEYRRDGTANALLTPNGGRGWQCR